MTSTQRVLLLVGSPKGAKSTSASLGAYLLEQLAAKGLATGQVHVHKALRSPGGQAELLAALKAADLVVLSSPLYLDSLPAPVIAALELICRDARPAGQGKVQRFAAIVNGGFPEARQSRTALAICRRFAREAGFVWAGGLGLGGGAAIDGQPLREAGGPATGARRALDLAAVALAEGQPIPEQAARLMARRLIPAWLYRWLAGRRLRGRAARNGVEARLYDRPYEA